jgi:CubicO group peptidase (beta-lactamase class C family)
LSASRAGKVKRAERKLKVSLRLLSVFGVPGSAFSSKIQTTFHFPFSPLLLWSAHEMKLRVFAAATLGFALSLRAEPVDVSSRLERIRVEHQLPALAAAAYDEGGLVAIGATGRRRARNNEPVTLDDRWHLASCTKSMTASLAAMLVEDGLISWDSTIGEIFPDLAPKMKKAWRGVTLEQLLVHRGGAPHDPPADLWKAAIARVGTPTEQRLAFVKGILGAEPERPPGSHWIYSDSGYAIVGAMLEKITGQPWEDLLRTRLFEPLGLKSAGFGAPATTGAVSEPWGHKGESPPYQPVPPGPTDDNPPAIGPAASVHMNIADFARYAAWHVEGERGWGTLLTEDSFHKLHTPPEEQRYAMGWAVVRRKWANGNALMHNGENTMFYAVMWLGPGQDTCFVAACNCDGAGAEEACNDAIAMLINSF